MANFLSREGFIVVGVNVRQYLMKFGPRHRTCPSTDPPADYRQMSALLERRGLLVQPVVLSGVSEGAALAVLAASAPENHEWVRGVITIGLPPTAELGVEVARLHVVDYEGGREGAVVRAEGFHRRVAPCRS